MKFCLQIMCILIFVPPSGEASECVPPPPLILQSTAVALWHEEKFDELDSYISAIVSEYPSSPSGLVLKAFQQWMLVGDVSGAVATLDALLTEFGSAQNRFAAGLLMRRRTLSGLAGELEEPSGHGAPAAAAGAMMKAAFDDLVPPGVPPPLMDLVSLAPVTVAIGELLPEISSPSADAIVPVDLPVSVEVGVAGSPCAVEVYANGVLIASDVDQPYSVEWMPSVVGANEIKAIARDITGRAEQSEIVTIMVQ